VIVSESVFRRLVAVVALILALASLALVGPFLAFAVILLAVLLLI
jgi:hypothetical protein